MDDLIEEILAELADPVPEGQQLTDLDDQVPPSVRIPANHGSRFLTTPQMSLRLTAPLQSFLLGGWKMMTHLTLVTSRSPMACMPEPAGWP